MNNYHSQERITDSAYIASKENSNEIAIKRYITRSPISVKINLTLSPRVDDNNKIQSINNNAFFSISPKESKFYCSPPHKKEHDFFQQQVSHIATNFAGYFDTLSKEKMSTETSKNIEQLKNNNINNNKKTNEGLNTPPLKCKLEKNKKARNSQKYYVKVKRANLVSNEIDFTGSISKTSSSEVVNKMNSDQYINTIKTLNFVAFERRVKSPCCKKIIQKETSSLSKETNDNSNFAHSSLLSENSFHSIKNSSNIKILNEKEESHDMLNHNKSYQIQPKLGFGGVINKIKEAEINLNRKRNRINSTDKNIEDKQMNFQNCFLRSFVDNSNKIEDSDEEFFGNSLKANYHEKSENQAESCFNYLFN